MRLTRLQLQDFRNITSADLVPGPAWTFLLGPNGQGKTNTLEAAGYAAALRSFRGADTRTLIRHGAPEAGIAHHIDHEHLGTTSLHIHLRPGGREVSLDGNRITRLADLLGRFPFVAFSSLDLQLLRGPPAARRRFLDLVLSTADSAYFAALSRFHRALDARNRLLKSGSPGPALDAFDLPLAQSAASLSTARREGTAALAASFVDAFASFAAAGETAALALHAASHHAASAWLALWTSQRMRDTAAGTTTSGPHRDDLLVTLNGHPAADFASEGQQRSLVLALKLAQLHLLHARTAIRPVLLADDVLGELDPGRRARFWSSLPADLQVLATGTSAPPPAPTPWTLVPVEHGRLLPPLPAPPD